MHLICHVTSQDHLLRAMQIMDGSSSWCVTILKSLVITGIVTVEI